MPVQRPTRQPIPHATDHVEFYFSTFANREEEMEETTWERVQNAWAAAGRKLSDWGVVSPRLMLAGGGLFLTLSNWGLLPSVRTFKGIHGWIPPLICTGSISTP